MTFVIRDYDKGNFTLNMQELTNHEISKLANKTTTIEAFSLVKDDVWYKIEVKIISDQVNIVMRDENETLIDWSNSPNEMAIDELVLLLANNTDKSVVFRDLKFEPLLDDIQTSEDNEKIVFDYTLIAISSICAIILIAIFAVAMSWIKKHRKHVEYLSFG